MNPIRSSALNIVLVRNKMFLKPTTVWLSTPKQLSGARDAQPFLYWGLDMPIFQTM
jgi:hypothetical protein